MKAFISYSHKDNSMLDMLHKHLTQLKRDGLISTWTDEEIHAGGKINQDISNALNSADIFIALLSPDYITSNYCYEKEFQTALEMQQQGRMIIIPIILEACDWLNTPFKEFKALPKDGKPISTWDNQNTAFLDVTQNIRKLISNSESASKQSQFITAPQVPLSRNYRIQKDFDTIEKLEFIEKSFAEIKEYIQRYIQEILQIDNIKVRIINDGNNKFSCLLVNRNKINTESQLNLYIASESSGFSIVQSTEKQLSYTISKSSRPSTKNFKLSFDQYHLFWKENNSYYSSSENKEYTTKEIADIIWNEWLESVGIL